MSRARPGRDGRGQFEVAGIVFLPAVVAALAMAVDAVVITGSTGDEPAPATGSALHTATRAAT